MNLIQQISVVVPIYKVEPYLDRCVESIVNQTYKNLEIILVDDGSPDRCPEMCDKWAQKDNRIRVIHKSNGGLSDARNVGMAIATGELMAFVDSDDWLAPDLYKHLYKRMQEDEGDIATCGVQMIWENGENPRILTPAGNCILNQMEAMQAIIDESWLKQPVWYKLYKTKLVQDILFPVGKYHEDVFWSYQAVGRANKVSVSDDIGYFYFQRSGSIMGERYSLKRLDAIEGKCNRQKYMEQHFPELKSKALVDLWFTCLYQGQMVLKELPSTERIMAWKYLNKILKKYQIGKKDIEELKISHRVWISMAKISLVKTCKIRNALKIGV